MGIPIILATTIATTHMTILSYLFSGAFREFYSEPLFVKYITKLFGKYLSVNSEKIIGWFIPYVSGLFFVIGFDILFAYNFIDLSWWSGFIFGLLAGGIGLGWWHLMFRISYSIDIDFKRYCIQLLLIYIAFGFTVVWVYRLLLM